MEEKDNKNEKEKMFDVVVTIGKARKIIAECVSEKDADKLVVIWANAEKVELKEGD